jgi:general secretion pathway protein J
MSAPGRPRRARAGEDGFTLIEVLVSLVLLALVLGLLSGVVRFARGTWDAAARLDREAGYDIAANFLRQRLGEALPLFERTATGAMRVTFQGTSDTLKFVAASQNGPAGAGLYALALEAASARGASQALFARVAPYQQARAGPEAPSEDHVLAENIKSVAFRYFGRKDRRQPPAWQDAWNRTDALPDLVEMTVNYADRRGPAVLLIELRLRNRT